MYQSIHILSSYNPLTVYLRRERVLSIEDICKIKQLNAPSPSSLLYFEQLFLSLSLAGLQSKVHTVYSLHCQCPRRIPLSHQILKSNQILSLNVFPFSFFLFCPLYFHQLSVLLLYEVSCYFAFGFAKESLVHVVSLSIEHEQS